MKTLTLILCLFSVVCLRSGWADDLPPLETVVDVSKVKSEPLFSALVHHLFWPTSDLAGGRKLERNRISDDVADLSSLLPTRLTKDYLPQGSIQTITDGVQDYWDGSDYLFAKYTTKKQQCVSIQDGRGMYVLIEPKEKNAPTNLAEYVHAVAVSALAYPAALVTSNKGARDTQIVTIKQPIGSL